MLWNRLDQLKCPVQPDGLSHGWWGGCAEWKCTCGSADLQILPLLLNGVCLGWDKLHCYTIPVLDARDCCSRSYSDTLALASCPGLWGGFQRTVSFRFLLFPSPCTCRTGWLGTCCIHRTPSVPSGLPVSPPDSLGRPWAVPHTLGWSIRPLSPRPSG